MNLLFSGFTVLTVSFIHIRSSGSSAHYRRNNSIDRPSGASEGHGPIPVFHIFFLVYSFCDVGGGNERGRLFFNRRLPIYIQDLARDRLATQRK